MNFFMPLAVFSLLSSSPDAFSKELGPTALRAEFTTDSEYLSDGPRDFCSLLTYPEAVRVAWRCDEGASLSLDWETGNLVLSDIPIPGFHAPLTLDYEGKVSPAVSEQIFSSLVEKLRACWSSDNCESEDPPPSFVSALIESADYKEAVLLRDEDAPVSDTPLREGVDLSIISGPLRSLSLLHIFQTGGCTFAAIDHSILLGNQTRAEMPTHLLVFEASGRDSSCLK